MTDFLPVEFKEKMKELLGDEFNSFLNVYEEKHNAGVRVNNLKATKEEFEKIAPFPITPVPWTKNGFYYNEQEYSPAKHPYYYAGLYYIQEPSAMTPASLLPIEPGDRVLDICAAPGGKSTELGARLNGRGVLVSNDISNSRAKALLKNIELFGIRNAIVISEAPSKLAEPFEGFFDKILVDAPCSGEGMFRKSHAIIKNWEQYGTGYYAKLQREILPFAIKMLKADGYMIYSTCTFSTEEDEGTLSYILENFPEMEVVPAADLTKESYKGFAKAVPELIGAPAEISNGLRLYPHRLKGEGHFVALLHKKADASVPFFSPSFKYGTKKGEISDEAFEFLKLLKFDIPKERLIVKEERLYLVPDELPDLKGLRVMRSGLLLGEMKKGRFEPSQALASSLRPGEYENTYNLRADDPDVIRYLKCETIEVPESVADGYVLVCVDSFPLGWGKVQGGRFKNKYLPGWRLM